MNKSCDLLQFAVVQLKFMQIRIASPSKYSTSSLRLRDRGNKSSEDIDTKIY